ncbi:MAG: hypothetical protein Q7T71_00230 [Herbiconiux sp.]|nr:hypothetical protein [Herbiconiux sp.]
MDDLLRGTLAASGDARDVGSVKSLGAVDVMVPPGELRIGHERYPMRGIPLAD